MDTRLIELGESFRFENDGMGSWLSQFLKCGRTNCGGTAQNPQVDGLIAAQVISALANQGKQVSDTNKLMETVRAVLVAMDAYQTVQTDPSVPGAVVIQVITRLQSQNLLTTITPINPPAPSTPIQVTPDTITTQDLLLYGGIGIGGLALLMMVTRR